MLTFESMKLVALMLVVASGCSLTFQSKPSSGVAIDTQCDTSGVPWKLDALGIAAGVAGVVAGFVVAARDENHDASTGNIIAGASALTAIGYTASMGNGIRWTRECRSARNQRVAVIR